MEDTQERLESKFGSWACVVSLASKLAITLATEQLVKWIALSVSCVCEHGLFTVRLHTPCEET